MHVDKNTDILKVRKQRPGLRPMSSQRLSAVRSMNILSPTAEEVSRDDHQIDFPQKVDAETVTAAKPSYNSEKAKQSPSKVENLAAVVEQTRRSNNSSPQQVPSPTNLTGSPTVVPRSPSPTEHIFHLPTPYPHQWTSHPSPPGSPSHVQPPASTGSLHSLKSTKLTSFVEIPIDPQVHLPPASRSSNYSINIQVPEPLLISQDSKENKPSFTDHEDILSSEEYHKGRHHNSLSDKKHPVVSLACTGTVLLDRLNSPVVAESSQFGFLPEARKPRRVGASEPGLPFKSQSKSDRRISKSLYEDSKRKRNLLDWSKLPFQKDPLLRVSEAEDTASLATLANALNSADSSTGSLAGFAHTCVVSKGGLQSQDSQPLKAPDKVITNNILAKFPSSISHEEVYATVTATCQEIQDSRVGDLQRGQFTETEHGVETPKQDSSKTIAIGMTSNKMSIVKIKIPEVGSTNSPAARNLGSPSKISALVAKFNGGPASELSINQSPNRTFMSISSAEPLSVAKSPGESLLAPYTTNGSSPTLSQKSTKSDRILQIQQSPLPTERNSKNDLNRQVTQHNDSTASRVTTPKRILRSSLRDPTPLRPVGRVLDMDGSVSIKPNPQLLEYSRYQPDRKSIMHRSTSLHKDTHDLKTIQNSSEEKAIHDMAGVASELSPNHSFTTLCDTSFEENEKSPSTKLILKTGKKFYDSVDTSTVSPRGRIPIQTSDCVSIGFPLDKTGPAISSTSSSPSKPRKPIPSILEPARIASPIESLVHVPAVDGPASVPSSSERDASRSESPRFKAVWTSPGLGRIGQESTAIADSSYFVHPGLLFNDKSIPRSKRVDQSENLSPRRGSLLHGEIRYLQQQISHKSERILELSSQVEILRTVDLQRLGRELIEARKEAQMWRRRAEIAESQLESTTKNISKHASLETTKNPAQHLRYSHSLIDGELQLANKTRQASQRLYDAEAGVWIHKGRFATGTDQAEVCKRRESEESTKTVLREAKGEISK
jgi:hypothetical protein